MNTAHEKLRGLYGGLEALYETDSGVDPTHHLLELPENDNGQREVLLLRQSDDGDFEVGLALDADTLEHLARATVDDAFSDALLGDTLPVLEGLSHLAYIAEAARCEQPVSGLELETQAEVDKLALCLLHRWPRARDDFESLVDRLYYRFSLIPSDADLRARYATANRLAVAFARRLWPHVAARKLTGFRRELRRFWRAPMSKKRALAA